MSAMSEMDIMVRNAVELMRDGMTSADAITKISNENNLSCALGDYLADAVTDAEEALQREDYAEDEYRDEYDAMLEQQEREDFAQDGYFENMDASEIY